METKKFEIDVKKIAVGTTKFVVGTAASVGAFIVAKKLLKGSLSSDAKTIEKIVTAIGVAALASAAGDIAQNQVEKDIDYVEKAYDSVVKAVNRFLDKDDEDSENLKDCTDEKEN